MSIEFEGIRFHHPQSDINCQAMLRQHIPINVSKDPPKINQRCTTETFLRASSTNLF